ncbi:MAG: SGNH/GDSL hydrolase family protein [Pseudolabrys sp.]|nr:SGNH/GDSL hydrolase family protein [Pseudolabrys sp.]
MKPEAVTLVYMGDSITEGQYVDSAFRWTDLVSDGLQKSYIATPVNLVLLNRGISGETTRQGLERFARDVQSHYPDVLTLQFGLNDCNCWVTDRGLPRVSLSAYRANLVEMIERARRFGASEIILSTNHPTLRRKTLMSGESLEEARIRYNEAVRQIAADTSVTFCDIESAFKGLDDAKLADVLLPYPDQLHLSKAGHETYAAAILPSIESAIQRVIKRRDS